MDLYFSPLARAMASRIAIGKEVKNNNTEDTEGTEKIRLGASRQVHHLPCPPWSLRGLRVIACLLHREHFTTRYQPGIAGMKPASKSQALPDPHHRPAIGTPAPPALALAAKCLLPPPSPPT